MTREAVTMTHSVSRAANLSAATAMGSHRWLRSPYPHRRRLGTMNMGRSMSRSECRRSNVSMRFQLAIEAHVVTSSGGQLLRAYHWLRIDQKKATIQDTAVRLDRDPSLEKEHRS